MALYRWLALGSCALGAAACSHAWDSYDPRAAGAGGDAAGAGGAVASSTSASSASAGGSAGAAVSSGSGSGGAATGAGGAGGSPVLPIGLVAAYAFDEGAGTQLFDATANHNDGTVLGAIWVTGKHGGALGFDGQNDHVVVPADPSWKIDGLTAYTFEAWVEVNQPGDYRGAIAIGPWSGTAALLIELGRWSFGIKTVGGPNDWTCSASSAPLAYLTTPDGQFHHVAGVLDATAGKCWLYLDGALAGTDGFVDGATSLGTGDLIVGGYDGSNYLQSVIDDVRIYKRALSLAEIQADMETPVDP